MRGKIFTMTKINQIEKEILSLDGGAFQNLCDSYLHKKRGLENINPLGILIGTNKVKKGTPDTFSRLPNGKYIFVESTLQKTDLFAKLDEDLGKCFDESKTGIKTNDIQEIIFCFGSVLKPNEEKSLQDKCSSRGILLSLFGIGTIAYDLYNRFPRLAKDHLGVEIDSGQIVEIDEFVSAYGKNRFASPLDTSFHFREEELKRLVDVLDTTSLVIISGQPGVGKSRLVLEACRTFSVSHPNYKVYSILNRTQDLFADLRDYFSDSGNYLIFVDDANRVSNFAYFIDLLQRQRQGQIIKVVATVRGYAVDKIKDIAKMYGEFAEIEIGNFSDDQIKKLIRDEYGIENNDYLERITDIAKGNSRIAVMAAKIASEANRLDSINDVSNLYDEYFSSIRQDVDVLIDSDILKTVGILAFYRGIDRLNEQQMSIIQSVFKFDPDVFWNIVCQLHEMEIVDIYENEVAKLSDQVLATYFFYLCFFKNKVIDFSLIFQIFFPDHISRIVDSLNPVANTFDRKIVEGVLLPIVEKVWNDLSRKQEKTDLLLFAKMFWPLVPTQVLDLIRTQIITIQSENIDISQVNFKPETNMPENSLLRILGGYSDMRGSWAEMALHLIFEYAEKRPSEIPYALQILVDYYGYDRHIFYRTSDVQNLVIDSLWKKMNQGTNELFSRMFIAIAEKYLYTYISSDEIKHTGVLTIYNFQLPARPDIFDFRQSVLEKLFSLFKSTEYENVILQVLHNYATDYHHVNEREIIASDSKFLLGFISSSLQPAVYLHDLFVQDYLDFLENHGVSIDQDIRLRFSGETFIVHRLITENWAERRKYEHAEYEQIKKKRLEVYFSECNLNEIEKFLDRCILIRDSLIANKNTFDLTHNILNAFIILSEKFPSLFVDSIRYYLMTGEKLSLHHPTPLVRKLLEISGLEQTYRILNEAPYPSKTKWIFGYYEALPEYQVGDKDAVNLLNLYRQAMPNDLPQHLDYLLNYQRVYPKIVVDVTKIILEKNDQVYCPFILAYLTNPHTEINKNLLTLYANDIDLLKTIYLFVVKNGQFDDYDASTLLKILSVNFDFMSEYISHMFSQGDGRAGWGRHDPDFSALWLQDNYFEIMRKIVDDVYRLEKYHYFTDLRRFFLPHDTESKEQMILERQDNLLQKIIEEKFADIDFVSFIFDMASNFSSERRIKLISQFIKFNKNLNDFEKLQINPTMRSWSGSEVPLIQESIDYYEKILSLLDNVDLLPHRRSIELQIQGLRSHLRSTMKREFLQD